jgi:hypothetical protein
MTIFALERLNANPRANGSLCLRNECLRSIPIALSISKPFENPLKMRTHDEEHEKDMV